MASSSNPIAQSAISNYYDVFINHRGPDVKETLATHLYQRLIVHKLRVFIDKEELQEGDNIPSHLYGAIRSASVHIAIFSTNYASSSWCLNELLLMLESGRTIIPIFYGVKPSELRWTFAENGMYARALQILEGQKTIDSQTRVEKQRYESHTIAEWRKALSRVADIKGFEVEAEACNSYQRQLLDKVVKRVLEKLPKTPLDVSKYPTGLDDKVKDLERTVLMPRQSGETRVVGIVGLGGVGKTTLAKELFNRERSKYDRSCFILDVREKAAGGSLNSLQSILHEDLTGSKWQINNTDEGIGELRKRVSSSPARALIVLDDLDHIHQLNVLLYPVKDALRLGSLILVTSRNKDVLTSFGIVETSIYKLKGLNPQHSQELFCMHAFGQPHPVVGFEPMVKEYLNACQALPLSLQVIESLLCGKHDLKYWKEQLHEISKILPEDIQNILKISYDGLNPDEKQIFLDIACFFIEEDRDTAIRIWDGSGSGGWLGLWKLENRCLVEVDSKNRIRMHDHLRDLGRGLAEKEPPGCELRLWRPTDNLLLNLSGQSPVRGISMVHRNEPEQSFENLAELAGSRLSTKISRLQLLRVEGNCVKNIFSVAQSSRLVWLCWYSCPFSSRICSVAQSQQLVWLRWYSCPFSSLSSWISLKNLRVLYIEGANLKTLWRHESQAPLHLRELNIDGPLLKVPKSIWKLKHLEKLVLRSTYGQIFLETLPDEFCHMYSLKHVELKNCGKMLLLPDSVGDLTNLVSLDLRKWAALQMLPDSVGSLTNLVSLGLSECFTLQMLPDSLGSLTNLQSLDLGQCSTLQMLPDSIGSLMNLQNLDLGGCSNLQMLPASVGNLMNPQSLDLGRCHTLQMLPDSVGKLTNLQSLELGGCSTLQMLPDSIGSLMNLQNLDLGGCSNLQMLPASVGNLMNPQSLDLGRCHTLQMLPDSVGKLTNLQSLELGGCSTLQMLPDSVGRLTNLQSLNVYRCSNLQMLPDSLGSLTNLESLNFNGCSNLKMLPDSVGSLTNLQSFNFNRCSNLQMLPDSVGSLTNLQDLNLYKCSNLQMLPDSVGSLTNLQSLDLRGCSSLQMLPDSVKTLANLQTLGLNECSSLHMLADSIGSLTNLQNILLEGCSTLQMLPDSVGSLTNLQNISIRKCSGLQKLPDSFGNLTNLKSIRLFKCSNLQTLPAVEHLNSLEELVVYGCPKLQWGAGVVEQLRQRLGQRFLENS